ncbi:MAG TPA: hypothetical protein VLJ58_21375 [Ramlibacter sp.]|nr:hypothetical protein [Ramlibacter sp.]
MSFLEYFNQAIHPQKGDDSRVNGLLQSLRIGFGKLPVLGGNGGRVVTVAADGTKLESAATTGTGDVVRATSPQLVTPRLGVAQADSVNKVTITEPATGATLTLADGSTLALSGAFSLTLTATGATNVTFPTTGTLATRAGAETLTNKTLTTPVINGFSGTGNGSITGDLAVSGAVSIGNTVNAVAPTAPDRTITMVIGGTTYYLHAKTTND